MKKYTFLFIAILLVSCSPQAEADTPTATKEPTSTATAMVIPTSTSLPSPTPPPTISLQEISSENANMLEQLHTLGRGEYITSAWWPDGETIAVLTSSGVSFFDSSTHGESLFVQPNSATLIKGGSFSFDGKSVASIYGDSSGVQIWDAFSGETLLDLGIEDTNGLDFSPDGQQLVTANPSNLNIWDVTDGSKVGSVNVLAPMEVLWSPDGKYLAYTSVFPQQRNVGIWDIENEVRIGEIPASSPADLSFSGDGSFLAFVDSLEEISIVDVTSAEVVNKLGEGTGQIHGAILSLDGKHIISGGSYFQGIRIYDSFTGEIQRHIEYLAANDFAIRPDGQQFVAGWSGLSLLAFPSGEVVADLGRFDNYSEVLFDIFNPFIAIGGISTRISWWDIATGDKKLGSREGMNAFTGLYSISHDGSIIGTKGWDEQEQTWTNYQLWDAESAIGVRRLFQLEGPVAPRAYAALRPFFSPNDDFIAIGFSEGQDHIVRVWDVGDGTLLFEKAVNSLAGYAFTADETLVIATENSILLTDPSTGDILSENQTGGKTTALTVHSKENMFIVGGTYGIQVWEPTDNEWGITMSFATELTAKEVQISPNGTLVAAIGTVMDQHRFTLWDIELNELVYLIDGQPVENEPENIQLLNSQQYELLFNNSGDVILVVGLENNHVQFSDSSSNELLYTAPSEMSGRRSIRPIQFSPDGTLFAYAAEDGTVRILAIP